MLKTSVILSFMLATSAAFAESNPYSGVLNTIERNGLPKISHTQSNLVTLQSAGIACAKDPSLLRRANADQTLASMLAGTPCTLQEHLVDANVKLDEIVDARVLYKNDADLAEITSYFRTQPILASVNWRFEKVSQLKIESPVVRYSYELAALSTQGR